MFILSSFRYTTSNGITRQETGHIKVVTNPDTREPDEIMDVEGLYSYTGTDGKFYQVTYTSDENGYVPHVTTSATRSDNVVVIGQQRTTRPPKEQFRNQYIFPYKKITTNPPKSKFPYKRRYWSNRYQSSHEDFSKLMMKCNWGWGEIFIYILFDY